MQFSSRDMDLLKTTDLLFLAQASEHSPSLATCQKIHPLAKVRIHVLSQTSRLLLPLRLGPTTLRHSLRCDPQRQHQMV